MAQGGLRLHFFARLIKETKKGRPKLVFKATYGTLLSSVVRRLPALSFTSTEDKIARYWPHFLPELLNLLCAKLLKCPITVIGPIYAVLFITSIRRPFTRRAWNAVRGEPQDPRLAEAPFFGSRPVCLRLAVCPRD